MINMITNLLSYKITMSELNRDFSYKIKERTRRALRYGFYAGEDSITFADFIDILNSDGRSYSFVRILHEAIIDASEKLGTFSWECPPITDETKSSRQFEFVAARTDSKDSQQDFLTFSQHFTNRKDPAYSFLNLTRDAIFISPAPKCDPIRGYVDYQNLSNFTKNSDPDTESFLWKLVAFKLNEELQDGKPRWLSSNNEGVQYLHIRIDKEPKHYTFQEYRNWIVEDLDKKKYKIMERPTLSRPEILMPESEKIRMHETKAHSEHGTLCQMMSNLNSDFTYVMKHSTRRILRYGLYRNKRQITFTDFIDILKSEQQSYSLVQKLIQAITDATDKLHEFSWECPSVTNQTKSSRHFEFVAFKSNPDNCEQDISPFKKHFSECQKHFFEGQTQVCSFSNKIGDATFVSPTPTFDDSGQLKDFKNISNFTKNSDFDRQCVFWKFVARKLEEELKDGQPRWLSSNGAKVQYFHIRIDRKPKHYQFRGYSNWTDFYDDDNNSSQMEVSESPPRPEIPKPAIAAKIAKREKSQKCESEEKSKYGTVCKIPKIMFEEYGVIHYECVVESSSILRYRFKSGQHPLTFDRFIEMLRSERHSVELTKNLGRALTDANKKLKAFFWECPPVIYDSKSAKQFEFIVNQSDSLNRIRQDFSPFDEHFRKCNDKACSFINLGGDAMLVSPKPARDTIGQFLDYKHLSSFAINSDFETQLVFWRLVASKLDEEIQDGRPRWLSTNGLGVHYLHIRIDKTPKYYTFHEYAYEDRRSPKKKRILYDASASYSRSNY